MIPASLRPGAELRLLDTASQRLRATYLGASEQRLEVQVSCGAGCEEASSSPWIALREVDVRVGRGRSVSQAVAGGVIGGAGAWGSAVLLGAILGKFRATDCQFDTGQCPALGLAVLTPVVIVTGGVIGASVGWRREQLRWERVWTSAAAH